ncbi:MAG TPA: 50S ribosomal protein L23 [Candidatus Polarisedimenticolia bacterium]|jgi:large subunit ribosomal protein L23|nr:50S ribosomal protein L23 [Candidatus Polarisedimenticolia bacterium]
MSRPAHQIVLAPLITEKSTKLKDAQELLCFRVARDANKIEIKRSIEELFNVKVATVRTALVHGKMKRVGRNLGKRPDWKKAYVRLRPGEKSIEYFEGV